MMRKKSLRQGRGKFNLEIMSEALVLSSVLEAMVALSHMLYLCIFAFDIIIVGKKRDHRILDPLIFSGNSEK